MLHNILSLYLWIGPHILLGGVTLLMLRNGRFRRFPFFFTYVVFEVFQFCLLFVMMRLDRISLSTYTQTDLLCRTGSLALHFGIIKELFESPLSHCPSLRKSVARPLHIGSILFVILASAFTALLYIDDGSAVIQPYVLEPVIDMAQCALLVVVFAWHRFLGVWMEGSAFGIAVGLGLVTGWGPLLHGLWNRTEANSSTLNLVTAAVFHVSVLIWLYFVQVQEKTLQAPNAQHPIDMSGWSAELARFSQL
jgi:hypothetical protein